MAPTAAGQLYQPTQPQQQYGPPPGYGYGGYPQGGGITLQQPQMLPVAVPNISGGINMQIEGAQLDKYQTAAIAGGQMGLQAFGMIGNMLNSFLNWDLQKLSLASQQEIALKFYDVQDSIAAKQTSVAMRQIDVQEHAIDTQRDMHREQTRHEQTLARLEGATQRQLALIAENGKSDRAKMLSVASDAFKRGSWDMGLPALPS